MMNRIVRDHYPATNLPKDLREGVAEDAEVRVIVEWTESAAEKPLSLEELFAMRKPPFRSTEEIVDEIRRQRDEWDD